LCVSGEYVVNTGGEESSSEFKGEGWGWFGGDYFGGEIKGVVCEGLDGGLSAGYKCGGGLEEGVENFNYGKG